MRHSITALLGAATLAATLGAANLHASRLDKPDAPSFRQGQGKVCIGCRIYVQSTSGRPIRLDRGPLGVVAEAPPNACADPGTSLGFPEEGEHLAAFLNSQPVDFK